MADHTVDRTGAETFTLSASAVDTIVVDPAGSCTAVRVINLDAGGGTRMWATGCRTPLNRRPDRTLVDPTDGGSDCHPVEAGGGWWSLDFPDGYSDLVTIKVVGGGNKYTIEVDAG